MKHLRTHSGKLPRRANTFVALNSFSPVSLSLAHHRLLILRARVGSRNGASCARTRVEEIPDVACLLPTLPKSTWGMLPDALLIGLSEPMAASRKSAGAM